MSRYTFKTLADQAKQAILDYVKDTFRGKAVTDLKLPTESRFAEMFGVSRITIRRALTDLENDGIILRRHGKGTFLNHAVVDIQSTFSPVMPFTEMISRAGFDATIRCVSVERVSAAAPLAKKLRVEDSTSVILAKKMFYADDRPCVYCEDYFPEAIMPEGMAIDKLADFHESLYDFFAEYTRHRIKWDLVELSATTRRSDAVLSRYFGEGSESNDALLMLKVLNFDQNDHPVLFSNEYINTDYIRLSSIRKKKL